MLRTTTLLDRETAVDVPLPDFELLAEFSAAEIDILSQHLEAKTYRAGETIIDADAPADTLYFLTAGSADVCVAGSGKTASTHLASVDAGNVVGELALLGQRSRTAAVVAATSARALALQAAEFAPLSRDYPEIRVKLLTAIGKSLSERLRRANGVIQLLSNSLNQTEIRCARCTGVWRSAPGRQSQWRFPTEGDV